MASTARTVASVSLLTTPERDLLRIVLFGRPSSGKTALLGAFIQAAQTQKATFPGELSDLSGRLDAICRSLYEGAKEPIPPGDMVSYPIRVEPQPVEPSEPQLPPLEAILIDCDGQAATRLLQEQLSENGRPDRQPLARAIRHADAFILLLDASTSAREIDEHLEEFVRFLRLVEKHRGDRVEVGGWPVFLVLTKSDALKKPGDTPVEWFERIEKRKQELGARFHEFLDRTHAVEPPRAAPPTRLSSHHEPPHAPRPTHRGFGWIQLTLWATATRHPSFGDGAEGALQPFGVAELFWQALEKAWIYRRHRRRSTRRLLWTTGGSLGLIAAMGLIMAALTLGAFSVYTSFQVSAAQRLAGSLPQLRKKLEDLLARRDAPGFTSLPSAEQEEVLRRISELQQYIPYMERLLRLPGPDTVFTQAELRHTLRLLQEELALPTPEWKRTEAAGIRERLLRDLGALDRAVEEVRRWYRIHGDRARQVWSFRDFPAPINWPLYRDAVEQALQAGTEPRWQPSDPVAEAGKQVTYEDVFRIDSVRDAREYLELYRQKLTQVRGVALALGLIEPAGGQLAALRVPRGASPADVRRLAEELRRDYPAYQSEMVLSQLPDAVRPTVSQTARTRYQYLLEPGRAEVLEAYRQTGPGPETLARWGKVRLWLDDPDTLSSWRVLAQTLIQLQDPQPPPPVKDLADFLGKGQLKLRVRLADVEVPALLDVTPQPGGSLQLGSPDGKGVELALDEGRTQHDILNGVWRYSFRRAEAAELTYKPGEPFRAVLGLRGGRQLSWVGGSRSSLFQIENIHMAPYLHQSGQAPTLGSREEGVRLRVVDPPDGIPHIPDLLPRVTK